MEALKIKNRSGSFSITISSKHEHRVIAVTGTIIIGSGKDCSIILEDKKVEDKHIVLEPRDDLLILHNNSKKTTLQGKALTLGRMYILEPDDIIKIGKTELIVANSIGPMPVGNFGLMQTPEPPQAKSLRDFTLNSVQFDTNISENLDNNNIILSDEVGSDLDTVSDKVVDFAKVRESVKDEGIDEEIEDIINKQNASVDNLDFNNSNGDIIENIDFVAKNTNNQNQTLPSAVKSNLTSFIKHGFSSSNAKKASIAFSLKAMPWGSRLYAFIVNLAIFGFITNTILPFYKLDKWIGSKWLVVFSKLKVYLDVLPKAEVFLPYINTLLKFYACFFILELLAALFLSCSLPVYLVGGSTSGNFITKRIKAIFRVLVDMCTAPLLVVNIPLLSKKRSFKEFVTGGTIIKEGKMPIFAYFILFPALLILCLYGELLLNRKLLTTPMLQTPFSLQESTMAMVSRNDTSEFFDFTIDKEVGDFVVLPFVSKDKNLNRNYLLFYNTKTKEELTFHRYSQKIDLLSILESTHSKLPQASLLTEILSLGITNLPKKLLTLGPYLTPYIKARDAIFKRFSPGRVPTFGLVTLGEQLCLIFSEVSNFRNSTRYYIIPVKNQAPIYVVNFKNDTSGIAADFLASYLSKINWSYQEGKGKGVYKLFDELYYKNDPNGLSKYYNSFNSKDKDLQAVIFRSREQNKSISL